jgi:hypothetical protein
MKKLLLLTVFGLFTTLVYAQNISLIDPITNVSGTENDIVYIKMHVKNNSNASMDILTQRKIVSLVPGHLSYFCFGITCYPPNVSVSPDVITLAPGQEDTSIKTYVDARGTIGSSTVNYCVFNSTKTDSACLTMVYNLGTTGIINNSHLKFVKAFPNPASTELTLVWNAASTALQYELQLTDLTGRVISSEGISAAEGMTKINVASMPRGMYISRLMQSGRVIAQDKILLQ